MPDPHGHAHVVLPPVAEGHVGMWSMVAADKGDLSMVYVLTPKRIGMTASALCRTGFKLALHSDTAK